MKTKFGFVWSSFSRSRNSFCVKRTVEQSLLSKKRTYSSPWPEKCIPYGFLRRISEKFEGVPCFFSRLIAIPATATRSLRLSYSVYESSLINSYRSLPLRRTSCSKGHANMKAKLKFCFYIPLFCLEKLDLWLFYEKLRTILLYFYNWPVNFKRILFCKLISFCFKMRCSCI